MQIHRLIFVAIFALSSAMLYSSESIVAYLNKKAPSSIERVESGKVYLQSERIIPSEKGIFFELGKHEHIALPYVVADEDGCYISEGMIIKGECTDCQWPLLRGILKCRNPHCSSSHAH